MIAPSRGFIRYLQVSPIVALQVERSRKSGPPPSELSQVVLPDCPFPRMTFERLTIWLEATVAAPSEKVLRVDYDPDDEMAEALPNALFALGLLAPSVIAPGHVVRLRHDVANARVTLNVKPGDADALDRA